MLEELKRDILNGKKTLADGITTALPTFRNKISEHKIAYLVNEYQGYHANALDWYKRPTKDYPAYRVLPGELKLMNTEDGSLSEMKHPLAEKKEFFIAAPVGWLEESVGLGIDPTMVEMAELGKVPNGLIVVLVDKARVDKVLDVVRQSLLAFIDEAAMDL